MMICLYIVVWCYYLPLLLLFPPHWKRCHRLLLLYIHIPHNHNGAHRVWGLISRIGVPSTRSSPDRSNENVVLVILYLPPLPYCCFLLLLFFCAFFDDDDDDNDETNTLSNLQSENPIRFGRYGVRVEKTPPTFLPPPNLAVQSLMEIV
jgi:hypothetical protein